MAEPRELEKYYYHEQGFDTIEEIEEWFEWQVPAQFNIAEYVCTRWADERKNGVALCVDRDTTAIRGRERPNQSSASVSTSVREARRLARSTNSSGSSSISPAWTPQRWA